MEWRPIESAPHDGTVIDLWIETDDGGGFREADCIRFRDAWCWEIAATDKCNEPQIVWGVEALWPDGTGTYGDRPMRRAAFWMPLPDPPNPHRQ